MAHDNLSRADGTGIIEVDVLEGIDLEQLARAVSSQGFINRLGLLLPAPVLRRIIASDPFERDVYVLVLCQNLFDLLKLWLERLLVQGRICGVLQCRISCQSLLLTIIILVTRI